MRHTPCASRCISTFQRPSGLESLILPPLYSQSYVATTRESPHPSTPEAFRYALSFMALNSSTGESNTLISNGSRTYSPVFYPSPQCLEEYDLFSYHQRNHQSIESSHHPQQCEIAYASICDLANSDHPTYSMAQIAPTARYSQQQFLHVAFCLLRKEHVLILFAPTLRSLQNLIRVEYRNNHFRTTQ